MESQRGIQTPVVCSPQHRLAHPRPSLSSRRTAPILLRFALLIGVVMALLPATLQGQGYQPIRVIDQANAVTFPGGLRVSLTAESEWDITDIRILYRLKGSGPWFSGSARFAPSRRVSAAFDGIISPGGYIPPGTTIEYHWEIEDAAGYSLATVPRDILYTDTRFDWQQVQAGPLTLRYHDRSSSRASRVVAQAADDLRYVQEMLGLDAIQPMLGIVYNNFDEAAPAFPNQSRNVSRQQVFHGYAFPSQGVFLGIGLDRDLLVHESAHLMFSQKLAGASYPAPAWLEEGFASYVEPGATPRSGRSLAERGPPLAAMAAVSGTPADIRIFYLKSESVVAFLIEEYGRASFRYFLDRLTAGLSTDQPCWPPMVSTPPGSKSVGRPATGEWLMEAQTEAAGAWTPTPSSSPSTPPCSAVSSCWSWPLGQSSTPSVGFAPAATRTNGTIWTPTIGKTDPLRVGPLFPRSVAISVVPFPPVSPFLRRTPRDSRWR